MGIMAAQIRLHEAVGDDLCLSLAGSPGGKQRFGKLVELFFGEDDHSLLLAQ